MEKSTQWNPSQYLKFAGPRLRPALDLLNQVNLTAPHSVYDLGCGAGNITRLMAERWPQAHIIGTDHSAEMLEKARAEASRIVWQESDVAQWESPEPTDLIYSNAVLHWLPDHKVLFPKLLQQLATGGMLALQMPLSWYSPSHQLMREVLEHGGKAGTALGSPTLREQLSQPTVGQSQDYYDILQPHTKQLNIWTTEYLHVLEGENAVLEWVKGTGLRPVLNELVGAEKEWFLEAYQQRLNAAYPRRGDGTTLYPFLRIFIVAKV